MTEARNRLRQAAIEREEERFTRLREARAQAIMQAYRESLDSVQDLEEITDDVASLRRKVTFLESVREASPGVKIAAVITALGGAAGVTELLRQIILALRG